MSLVALLPSHVFLSHLSLTFRLLLLVLLALCWLYGKLVLCAFLLHMGIEARRGKHVPDVVHNASQLSGNDFSPGPCSCNSDGVYFAACAVICLQVTHLGLTSRNA